MNIAASWSAYCLNVVGSPGSAGAERAVFLHHHMIPRAIDLPTLLRVVKLERLAARRFQADVVVQAGFPGEQLEQGRHATDAIAIEVMHEVGVIVPHRRMRAVGEAVADEQNGLRRCRRRRTDNASGRRQAHQDEETAERTDLAGRRGRERNTHHGQACSLEAGGITRQHAMRGTPSPMGRFHIRRVGIRALRA